jgi:hypothetical protein
LKTELLVKTPFSPDRVSGVTDQSGNRPSEYLANIVDFLQRAKAHGIYAGIVSEFIPDTGTYADFPRSDSAGSTNVYFLTRAGVEANARFLADFVGELIRQRVLLDAIWAHEPWEEAYLLADAAPFTWTSGSFTSANGTPKPTRDEKPV